MPGCHVPTGAVRAVHQGAFLPPGVLHVRLLGKARGKFMRLVMLGCPVVMSFFMKVTLMSKHCNGQVWEQSPWHGHWSVHKVCVFFYHSAHNVIVVVPLVVCFSRISESIC